MRMNLHLADSQSYYDWIALGVPLCSLFLIMCNSEIWTTVIAGVFESS